MFIGHFGAGFAIKRAAPMLSLGTLFLASVFVDILAAPLLLVGIETIKIAPGHTEVVSLDLANISYSHSFLSTVVSAAIIAGVHYGMNRQLANAIWLGLAVCFHWVLDLITHASDLLLVPWDTQPLGLGLWNSLPGTLLVEGTLFIGGVFVYMRFTKAKDQKGTFGALALAGTLVALYLASVFGPPPASPHAVTAIQFGFILFVIWGGWVDRHRVTRTDCAPDSC